MKDFNPQISPLTEGSRGRSRWLWSLAAGCLLLIVLALLSPRWRDNPAAGPASADMAGPSAAVDSASADRARLRQRRSGSAPAPSAEEIVAGKVSQFVRSRRDIAHAMARRFKIEVPADLERFFDAAEAGRVDEMKALYDSLIERRNQELGANLRELWPSIHETLGVAQEAHQWPAQKLLDYGNAVLGSLRPGMVYVGGTDPGRFIPTLLNETSDAERHIVLTQNALADNTYLDYLSFLYGDRFATLTQDDSQHAFQDYLADAQKRLLHDQQFPDEPKQIRPGEDVRTTDNKVQVSGQVAVMAVNEKLFRM
jgi:hypothetical protein